MKPFGTIYLEISDQCNAQCPYCITGRSIKKDRAFFIAPALFDNVLQCLFDKGFAHKKTCIALYVWGEPFLHPEFPELMRLGAKRHAKFALSTNASIIPKITKDFVQAVSSMRFSCSGYSQESYKRIHGFDAQKIRHNIATIVNTARALGGKHIDFDINFHIYQFNQDELYDMKCFARKLNIRLSANYAILNDWDLTCAWIQNALQYKDLLQISEDLFNYIPAQTLKNIPQHFVCPQKNLLVLDAKADVYLCCQVPHQRVFSLGNIFDNDIEEKIATRFTHAVCKKCIELGMAYMFHNILLSPQWATSLDIKKSSLKSVLYWLKRKLYA